MANDWSSGLTDSDELSSFPSAASPLSAMGLDPDEVRANPEILLRATSGGGVTSDRGGSADAQARLMRSPGGAMAPGETSAQAAGATGGAGSSPTPSPDPEQVGMSALTTSLKNESQLANQVPTSDPDVTRLTAQREKLGTPAPLYDPQTGKMLAEDKPSLGTRVWRGVRGGLVGGLTGGIPGAIVGAIEPGKIAGGQAYGAPNKTYQRNEQRREQQLQATDSSLENARKNWKDAVEAMKTKGAILGDVTKTGSDIVSGTGKLETADTRRLLAEATAENYKSKIQQAQDQLAQRYEQMNNSKQTAEDRIAAMREANDLKNQIQMMNQQFLRQRLDTTTDARTLDNQEKEDINAIEKRYSGAITGTWNRIWGNKDQEIASTHQMYQDRRKALGIMPGGGAPANPAAAAPGKGGAPQTATGPNGHKIMVKNGRWVDAKTGVPVQ